MKIGFIIAVIIYEIAVIAIVSVVTKKMDAKKGIVASEDDFMLAGRGMGVAVLAPTIALTVLGAAHICGIFEMTYGMGAISMWFSLAHVTMIVIGCLVTGQWVRHFGITTVPQLVKDMYGKKVAICMSCVIASQCWGVLTIECQGMGVVISALTGMNLRLSVIVGGVIGVLWVIFAGMKELGSVNLVNIIVMYIGLVIATIACGMKLGGFGIIDQTFVGPDKWMTSLFGTPALFISFAVGNIIAVTFCQSISQMLMQTMMSAKDEKTIRKSLWFCAPLNGFFGCFSVVLGLAARAIPEYAAAGGKQAAMTMIVNLLPAWIAILLLAALLAAILSTFAMTSLTSSTIWVHDIYVKILNPNASEKQVTKMMRILIVIMAASAVCISISLPTILDAINWVFSWIIPIFFCIMIGMIWKRNEKVALAALIVCWIANVIWSFTPIKDVIAGATGVAFPNAYVTAILSILILLIGNAASSKSLGAYKNSPEAHAAAVAAGTEE